MPIKKQTEFPFIICKEKFLQLSIVTKNFTADFFARFCFLLGLNAFFASKWSNIIFTCVKLPSKFAIGLFEIGYPAARMFDGETFKLQRSKLNRKWCPDIFACM